MPSGPATGERPRWTPPWILLAEETHFLLGALFVLGFDAILRAPVVGALAIMALGVLKEFTWDLRIEGATWRDGAKDVAFYSAGVLVALGLVAIGGLR